ncbi:MAG TPA: hypothetical protein DHW82_01660 [Spirochaetia bacterium]|nr:MAG: hypothetical protein A2Y41_10145 [Spirochaetes bacterium GWB1_36_13]HCL55701.1 hypothetical protein [Spirochaetia bacterium]
MNKNLVLIINNESLLKSISGAFVEKDFTVFPFYHFEDVPDYLFSMENLFIWEIGEIDPRNLKWVDFLKEQKTIKFILIDFINDAFLMSLIHADTTPQELYEKSYKLRDLINMSEMVFDSDYSFVNLSSYLKLNSFIFSHEIKEGENYLEEAEIVITDFLKKNNLAAGIKDLDLFFLALGEVVENFIEYQLIRLNKTPSIIIEYGYDNEKIIISVRDDLGKANFLPLFKSFIRKTSVQKKIQEEVSQNENKRNKDNIPDDYNKEGIYIGAQGRGMSIIKQGVHRLISIVKKESEKEISKRTQFIFIVYLDKRELEDNSSVNMLVFF